MDEYYASTFTQRKVQLSQEVSTLKKKLIVHTPLKYTPSFVLVKEKPESNLRHLESYVLKE